MRAIPFLLMVLVTANPAAAQDSRWAAAKAPAVPEADGYVPIPAAAVPPSPTHIYKAIFDATHAADRPDRLIPALNMAGSELNALRVSGVPPENAQFVVVFHGAAARGVLNNETYKARFGVDNPNLSVLKELKSTGVQLYVCGQQLASEDVDRATLAPDVEVASDALTVLMTFQNRGYALMSF